jgi:very-short-patch-repair endonuclease
MLPNRVAETRTTLLLESLPSHLSGIAPGKILTVSGLDVQTLRATLEASPTTAPQCLVLNCDVRSDAQSQIQTVLDDLADLALAFWPAWRSPQTDVPSTENSWLLAASRLAISGKRPRFRRTSLTLELQQLFKVLPSNLLLVAQLDTAAPLGAAAAIATFEWCAQHGARVVILCAGPLPVTPPFDRILYGTIEIAKPRLPVTERWIGPRGAPHPASQIEKHVYDAISNDPELAPLFSFNKNVETNALGSTPCVDLLWQEGRVVVELDGAEHFGDPKYGHDRHRDYELLVAGYLVLRITNRQVATDLAYVIEKIRNVVRYRRSQWSLKE